MKIAVCDDCYEDVLKLKNMLVGHDIRIYSDTECLIDEVKHQEKSFDLYLLDIFMGNSARGIELAKEIRAQDEGAAICFVSTSDDFYRQAYDLYAVQYLIKPVEEKMLQQLIDRVLNSIVRDREQSLYYRWRGQEGSIPYGNILYINSREHTLFIHCRDGHVQECKGKLEEMAERICGQVFFRCHQSFIVNMYYVDRLEGNDLMISGDRIPISRRYYKETKKRYQEVLFEEVD